MYIVVLLRSNDTFDMIIAIDVRLLCSFEIEIILSKWYLSKSLAMRIRPTTIQFYR